MCVHSSLLWVWWNDIVRCSCESSPLFELLLASAFFEFPHLVVQWTYWSAFEPPRNAVRVENVIAVTPADSTGRRACSRWLAFYANIHNVIPANSTGLYLDIPRPKGNCRPLLDFKPLLLGRNLMWRRGWRSWRFYLHFIRHFFQVNPDYVALKNETRSAIQPM